MTSSSYILSILSSCLSGLLIGSIANAEATQSFASPLTIDHERIALDGDEDGVRVSRASVPLAFAYESYLAIREQESVKLSRFPLAPLARGGEPTEVTLELTRSQAVNENTQFVVASVAEDGAIIERPMETPDVAVFSGKIVGDESSFVFLSLSPYGSHGFIRTQGITQAISPGPYGSDHTPLIYNMDAIPRGAIHWHEFLCDAQAHDEAWPEVIHVDEGNGVINQATDDPPCRLSEIAIETDKEFTDDLFSGDELSAGAYATTLLSASSEIFQENINVSFDVVFVRLWTDTDPWNQNSTVDQLFQFRDYWNDNMGHIDRDLAHYLSGRSLGGGVAWLNAVCHTTLGYALSANLSGSFPYPLQDNHPQNWDIMVVTHEFGHNFGTPHTHDFCPPLDECPPPNLFGSCQDQQNCTSQGTIMSYCHLCQGGLGNVVLEFHPAVQQTMLEYLDTVTNCNLDCDAGPQLEVVYVPEDTASIQQAIEYVVSGGEIIVSPGTYNESIDPGGKQVHIQSTDGPEVTVIDASGLNDTVVRFSNNESSQTILNGFTLTGGTGASVTLGNTTFILGGGMYVADASPTVFNCIITGNSAEFGGGVFIHGETPIFQNCVIAENTSNPESGGGVFNFNSASPTFTNVEFTGNFSAADGGAMASHESSPTVTNGTFFDNEAAINGGAVRHVQQSAGSFSGSTFQGNIAGNEGGAFFSDNSPAVHIVDSEFCENAPNHITGSYTDSGGNVFLDVCPGPCLIVGDLDCNGVVNAEDLFLLLEAWGDCPDPNGCPADLSGNGVVGVEDLFILLENWG